MAARRTRRPPSMRVPRCRRKYPGGRGDPPVVGLHPTVASSLLGLHCWESATAADPDWQSVGYRGPDPEQLRSRPDSDSGIFVAGVPPVCCRPVPASPIRVMVRGIFGRLQSRNRQPSSPFTATDAADATLTTRCRYHHGIGGRNRRRTLPAAFEPTAQVDGRRAPQQPGQWLRRLSVEEGDDTDRLCGQWVRWVPAAAPSTFPTRLYSDAPRLDYETEFSGTLPRLGAWLCGQWKIGYCTCRVDGQRRVRPKAADSPTCGWTGSQTVGDGRENHGECSRVQGFTR